MNKILGSSLMMTAVLLITSCDKTQSYADMLKAEEKAIERLMDEEDIVVLKEYPADGVFKENEFYQMDNDVYINVIDSGNGNRIGTKRQNVNVRMSIVVLWCVSSSRILLNWMVLPILIYLLLFLIRNIQKITIFGDMIRMIPMWMR